MLARWVYSNCQLFREKTVHEVGSGCGLVKKKKQSDFLFNSLTLHIGRYLGIILLKKGDPVRLQTGGRVVVRFGNEDECN